MEKINCDIIMDLLPSYLDGICSEQTKLCVEEHIMSCESCREKAELLKKTDFSVEKLEQKEINVIKKVKGHIRNTGVMVYVMLWAVVILGLMVNAYRYNDGFLVNVYDVVLPVSMIGTYALTLLQTERRRREKSDIVAGIFSVLIDIYASFLVYYSIREFHNGNFPFGIKEALALGPFIRRQLIAAVLMQLLLLVWILIKTMKKGFLSSILPNICLFGACYILSINTWLLMLDTHYYPLSMFRTTKYIFIIGIVGSALIFFIDQWRWKQKDKSRNY